MASFDVPEATLDLMTKFINNPAKLFANHSSIEIPKPVLQSPVEAPKPVEQAPLPTVTPNHYAGGLFIIFFLTAAVMAGLFIKRKLATRSPEWYSIFIRNMLPADEIELIYPSSYNNENEENPDSTLLPRNANKVKSNDD